MSAKILVISGSRDIEDIPFIQAALNQMWSQFGPFDEVRVGDARGVDEHAYELAVAAEEKADFDLERYVADWDKEGKVAGFNRNSRMINGATHLLAIWNTRSRGTHHAIKEARDAGLTVRIAVH